MSDEATPATVRLTDKLGPLPEPWIFGGVMHAPLEGTYTAQQMRAYALQERAAERDRIRSTLMAWHERDKSCHNYWAWAARELFDNAPD